MSSTTIHHIDFQAVLLKIFDVVRFDSLLCMLMILLWILAGGNDVSISGACCCADFEMLQFGIVIDAALIVLVLKTVIVGIMSMFI